MLSVDTIAWQRPGVGMTTMSTLTCSGGVALDDVWLCSDWTLESGPNGFPVLPTGDELLGMDGGRYLKLDDFKDQDDDFLSPKKTLRDFEGGAGTTYVCARDHAERRAAIKPLPVPQAVLPRHSQNSVRVPGDGHVGPGEWRTFSNTGGADASIGVQRLCCPLLVRSENKLLF